MSQRLSVVLGLIIFATAVASAMIVEAGAGDRVSLSWLP
jgi:hypothetical protein